MFSTTSMDEPLTSHPTDSELDTFVRRTATASALIQLDRHLAGCPPCRARLQQCAGLDSVFAHLRADLAATLPPEHLSEEAIQTAAMGETPAEVAEHLRACALCGAEVDDLRRFITSERSRGRLHRPSLWAVAAAALMVASTAVVWQVVHRRKQPELASSLNDAGGVVGLDRAGKLHTPASWPPEYAAVVTQAIANGRLESEPIASLGRKPEFLLGESARQAQFSLHHPIGEAVATDHPEFSWAALSSASTYRVSVYDESFRKIAASSDLSSNTWTGIQPLPAGHAYYWTVTARVGTHDVREPVPPAPEAKFVVLAKDRIEQLHEAERRYPDAHLLLAALFAKAGAFTEASRQLTALQRANPESDLVRRLSASLGQ